MRHAHGAPGIRHQGQGRRRRGICENVQRDEAEKGHYALYRRRGQRQGKDRIQPEREGSRAVVQPFPRRAGSRLYAGRDSRAFRGKNGDSQPGRPKCGRMGGGQHGERAKRTP